MRYFIGFMLLIALLILLIVLLITGGGRDDKVVIPPKELASYSSTDAQVSFRYDGRINAASLHRQILITVDRDYVVYKQLAGYDGQVILTRKFANTENSYNVFLSALGHLGFTESDDDPALQNEKGYCPLGQRYIFEMNEGAEQLERSWATSCGGTKTYLGALTTTISVFQAQVPNYSQLSSTVQL